VDLTLQSDAIMNNFDTRPEFTLPVTPRYDGTMYQNQRLTNYNQAPKSTRLSKVQAYQPAVMQPQMKNSQSSTFIPQVVPPKDLRSFNSVPNTIQVVAPKNFRRDYQNTSTRGNVSNVQNEYYQRNPNADVNNSTLRQSLNLLKMATTMNQRRVPIANYASMNTVVNHAPLQDPRLMPNQYMRQPQNPAQNYGRYVPVKNMNIAPGQSYGHPMHQNHGSFHSQKTVPTPEKVSLSTEYQSPDYIRSKCYNLIQIDDNLSNGSGDVNPFKVVQTPPKLENVYQNVSGNSLIFMVQFWLMRNFMSL
jgi:hypothetical protein